MDEFSLSSESSVDLGESVMGGREWSGREKAGWGILGIVFILIGLFLIIWAFVSVGYMDDWFFGVAGKKPSNLWSGEHLSAQWKQERALSSKSNWGGPMYERCGDRY